MPDSVDPTRTPKTAAEIVSTGLVGLTGLELVDLDASARGTLCPSAA